MLQTLVITCVACAAAWVFDPIITECRRKQLTANTVWKPFGIYKGHVLYERIYESGKKSWRYEDKDGDGHIYLGTSAVQNEIITPL